MKSTELGIRLSVDHVCWTEVLVGYTRANLNAPPEVLRAAKAHEEESPKCRDYLHQCCQFIVGING